MNMIEEHNGVKILYTHGSYYEMGHHHGELLKKTDLRKHMRYT